MPEYPASGPASPKPTTSRKYRTLLAFDHGAQRIGVAVGEELTRSARPLCLLSARQGEPNWPELLKVLHEWRPNALVVGVPRHADGRPSKSTDAALHFCAQLKQHTELPIFTSDERLSSNEAKRWLNERPSFAQRHARLDPVAAAVILETWLNQQEVSDDSF